MLFELTEETVQRVEVLTDPGRGLTADAVINRALDCYQQNTPQPNSGEKSAAEVLARFRKYRGILSGVTPEEIVAARHEGLP